MVSASSLPPIIYGKIERVLDNNSLELEKHLVVKDSCGKAMLSAKVLSKKDFQGVDEQTMLEFLEARKITIVDKKGKQKEIYISIDSIRAENPLFETVLKKCKNNNEIFNKVMLHQQVERKIEQLKTINIKIDKPKIKLIDGKKVKGHESIKLSEEQIKEIVTQIEKKKNKWLKEAEGKGEWIQRKVKVTGIDKEIKIDIFPSTRENIEKLGQIDIRMDFVGKGSLKNAYRDLHYDKNKVYIGSYATTKKGFERIETEIVISKEISSDEVKELEKAQKGKLLTSKAIDVRNKTTKTSQFISKYKFVQTFYDQGTAQQVLANQMLSDGTPIGEKEHLSIIILSLEALEKLHKKNIIHRDIKPENLLLKSTKDGGFKVAIGDFDIATKDKQGTELAGTPGYIPPETLWNFEKGNKVSYAATGDIYSLGMSLHTGSNIQLHPWWNADRTFNMTFLNGYFVFKLPVSEPLDKKSIQWGLWKMSHIAPEERYQSATEAKKFFEEIAKRKGYII